MGQAKKRGTYAQRQAEAKAKALREAKARKPWNRLRARVSAALRELFAAVRCR